jgi:hypothetical protein
LEKKMKSLPIDINVFPYREILEMASEFIPKDIDEKISRRMDDAERAKVIGPEAAKVMAILRKVPGITPASSRDLKDSTNLYKLKDGTIVSRYVNPVGCEHVFLSNNNGECVFGGWVGWVHNEGLKKTVDEIGDKYGDS